MSTEMGCTGHAAKRQTEAEPRFLTQHRYSKLGNHSNGDQNSNEHLLNAAFMQGNPVSTLHVLLPFILTRTHGSSPCTVGETEAREVP